MPGRRKGDDLSPIFASCKSAVLFVPSLPTQTKHGRHTFYLRSALPRCRDGSGSGLRSGRLLCLPILVHFHQLMNAIDHHITRGILYASVACIFLCSSGYLNVMGFSYLIITITIISLWPVGLVLSPLFPRSCQCTTQQRSCQIGHLAGRGGPY